MRILVAAGIPRAIGMERGYAVKSITTATPRTPRALRVMETIDRARHLLILAGEARGLYNLLQVGRLCYLDRNQKRSMGKPIPWGGR